jgi:putative iron-regulated protein
MGRTPTRLAVLAVVIMGLHGCGRSQEQAPPPVRLNAELSAEVLRTYADLAHAKYSDALEGARALHAALLALLQAPSSQTLERARTSWLAAREPYVQTEVFRFYDGPIDQVELLVNSWPIDENYVDGDDATPGIVQDRARYPELTAAGIQKLNMTESETSVSAGYHVIEFLLWGRDARADGPGDRSHADYVSEEADSVQARRGQYLRLVSELLVSHLDQVSEAWAPGRSDNYRARFLAMPPAQSLALIIKGMGALSGPELAGERLTVAYETKDQENQHSCFSDSTHRDMVGNALGIENVCQGRYASARGRSVNGPGLCALVKAADASLGAQLERELRDSVAAARTIPAPFEQAILGSDQAPGRQAILKTIRALEAQARTLTKVATRLGLDLGLGQARAEAR